MVLAALPGHFDSALTQRAALQAGAALTLQALPDHLQASCRSVVETTILGIPTTRCT